VTTIRDGSRSLASSVTRERDEKRVPTMRRPPRADAPMPPSDVAPTRGREYPVRLGASLVGRPEDGGDGDDGGDDDARALTVLRYDWRSSDADETRRASVRATPSGAVEVTYASKTNPMDGTVRYRGMRRVKKGRRDEDVEEGERAGEGASEDAGVDCALMFDETTGTFTLERVGCVVGSLRIARTDEGRVGAGELGDGVGVREGAAGGSTAEDDADGGKTEELFPSSPRKKPKTKMKTDV